jgi:hypothetical protein
MQKTFQLLKLSRPRIYVKNLIGFFYGLISHILVVHKLDRKEKALISCQ